MKQILRLALTLLGLHIGLAKADPLTWSIDGEYHYFDAAPANELLSPENYKKYRQFLRDENCPAATALLNLAFVDRYPQFSDVAIGRERFDDWHFRLVHKKYKDLSFCSWIDRFKEIEQKIKTANASIGPYLGDGPRPRKAKHKKLWEHRDGVVSSLILWASHDYVPALLRLIAITRHGDLFDIATDIEYYLLKRLCEIGHDCSELGDRIAELEQQLPATRAKAIADKAASRNVIDKVLKYGSDF